MEKHFDISVFSPEKGWFATIFTDITEKILSKEKIMESEIRFRSLAENAPGVISLIDKEVIFRVSAGQGLKDIGLAQHMVEGQSVFELYKGKPVLKTIKKALTGVPCNEIFLVQNDQYFETIFTPIFDSNNEVTGIINFALNITDRKLAEEEIVKLNEELELRVAQRTEQLHEVNKELESFVYSVSHDLRAPLRSIMGFSEIILKRYKESLNEEGLEYFGDILEASKNRANLIEDLLHFSRLTKQQIDKDLINLHELFETVLKNLNQDIQDNQANITLPEKMPDIPGDRSLLTQIFTNLIHNAILYHRNGIKPEIRLSVEENEQSVFIHVTDNGQGIPKEHHEKIFNIFQRLHANDKYPGTGIGLSIVKKAVTALGGVITLESDENRGTRFTVTLPKM